MNQVRKRAALASAIVVALALLVIMVGVFWFGWYETRQNRELLAALPVYPGAEAVQDHPHFVESDENPLTPPDKWVILRTYKVPSGAAGKEVAGFYMDEMPPEWVRCFRHASTYNPETGEEGVLFQGAVFIQERLYVSVDIVNLGVRQRTYDVYVDRNREMHHDPCEPRPFGANWSLANSAPWMTEEEWLARAVLDCREVMDGDLEPSLMRMFPEAESLDDAKSRFVRGDWANTVELKAMLERYCPSSVRPPS